MDRSYAKKVIGKSVRRALPGLFRALDRKAEVRRMDNVEAVLADTAAPNVDAAVADFGRLQVEYPPRGEYGYDPRSTWVRAADRVRGLLALDGIEEPGCRILEVACGDGMAGYLMHGYGHRVQLTDLEDWRDGRARELPFEASDLAIGLPFPDAHFDLVCSYNAFEHFPDPALAFREMLRVCRPGGLMYFEFGPLYASPWGLHAYRSLRMPYPQFLFPIPYILDKLAEIGIQDLGRERTELQPMNEWRVEQFWRLWRSGGCEIISERELRDHSHLGLVQRYPECFRGRGLSIDDLIVQALFVTLRRSAASVEPR